MTVTAKMVQELRSKSGAGLMECKKALQATDGNVEAAFDHLRKSGLKTADKKAGRSMGEGRVQAKITADGKCGAMVLLSCETDFVARTDEFQSLLEGLVDCVLEYRPGSPEEINQLTLGNTTVEESVKSLSGKLGENMSVRQLAFYENEGGRVGCYVHHDSKKGVLISVSTSAPEKAEGFLRDLGMHVAAIRPTHLHREDVPEDVLEREKDIYREKIKDKPAEMQEKILSGQINAFFKQIVLVDQPWVKDDKLTVARALSEGVSSDAAIAGFSHFVAGV